MYFYFFTYILFNSTNNNNNHILDYVIRLQSTYILSIYLYYLHLSCCEAVVLLVVATAVVFLFIIYEILLFQ